jgi:hypothetical protein
MGSAYCARGGTSAARKPRKIEEKIRVMDSLERLVSQIMENCLSSRGDTSLRPPPGGAQQAVKTWGLAEGV